MRQSITLLNLFWALALANNANGAYVVKEIVLEVNQQCGASNVSIELRQPGKNNKHHIICSVKPKASQKKLVWRTSADLNSCKNIFISNSMRVAVQSNQQICPSNVLIVARNDEIFRASLPKPYLETDKQNSYALTKLKGVKEIILANGHWKDCSGTNVSLKIIDPIGGKSCVVAPKDNVYGNRLVRWTGAELNYCISMKVDQRSLVHFMTPGNDGFCPRRTTIRMNDETNTLWETKGELNIYEFYNKTTNEVDHSLHKRWPLPGGLYIRKPEEPLICPTDDDDTCQAKDMLAYKISGRKSMNCIFECASLTSVNQSTKYDVTKATGFRCLKVGYEAVQFDWCCKTKRTSGGIPFCPDVVSNDQMNTKTTETSEMIIDETEDEAQCPVSGCPIEAVKTYHDRDAAKANENCQIQYQCDFIQSSNGKDPNSGVKCTPTRRPKRKLNLCCDDPNAVSDLQQCSTREQT